MIPLTIRSRILANKALLCKLPKQQTFMLSKLYTTDSGSKDELTHDDQQPHHHEETKKKEDLEVWELESSKDRPTTSRVVQRHASESKAVLEFSQLLDDILSYNTKRSEGPAKKATPSPPPSLSDEAISMRILELFEKQKTVHKKRKPLPQSAVGPMYGGIAQSSLFNRQEPEDPEDDPLLEHLSPMSQEYNWDQTIVSKNQHITAKQEEMEATQAIVEAPSTLDLWHHIETEINRENYPNYYPTVLTKAIEHASKTDPYMALTIFEKAKQKSVVSYISGCTVQVYNAMLLLRWEVWRDINGMLDLAEEMTVNGIEFDNQSRRIIRTAVLEVESEGGGDGGYLDPQEDANDGVFWNADEKRNCNLLKELAGKWMISE
ncbi:uncharacterized protein ATC70_005313 [Mucor velutinosus]|uniref:Mtf2-like C-terminal domain-containing protein n=1 Tax=Mucor velutinosus TaxID=708070 RepID=A0AAN7HWQ6_9FUNG|nr:hypothetical protein ATC70_005313 [Mucor velutinosus]